MSWTRRVSFVAESVFGHVIGGVDMGGRSLEGQHRGATRLRHGVWQGWWGLDGGVMCQPCVCGQFAGWMSSYH